jgi:hypothetical protein
MRQRYPADNQNNLILTSRFTGHLIKGSLCANATFGRARFLVVVSREALQQRFEYDLDPHTPWIDIALTGEEREALRREAEQICCGGGPPVNGVLEL